MGTLRQNFCPCGDFLMPYSRGEYGDFASVQLKGDWLRSTNGKMAEEKKKYFGEPYTFVINRDKFRTPYKLLSIEKLDFLKKFSQEC